MYVRFVRQRRIEGMRARAGIFNAAYELKRKPELDDQTYQTLTDMLNWFEYNLYLPLRFNRTKSKAYLYKNTKGLSWFKPSATDALNRARQMRSLLKKHGYKIEELQTERVGYVVYEDDYQIVAEPFADTPV